MSQTLTCPHCDATFRTKQEFPAGKKIRCPKCSKPFAIPDEEETDAEEVGDKVKAKAKAGKAQRREEDNEDAPPPNKKKRPPDERDDEDEDKPRGKKNKPKAKSNTLVFGLAIAGAFVLLLVCGGGIGIWFVTKGAPNPVISKDNGPVPSKDKAPVPVAKSGMNLEIWNQLEIFMKKDAVAKLCGPGKNATESDVTACLQRAGLNQQISTELLDAARKSGVRSWQEYLGGDDTLFVGYAPTKRGDRAAYGLWVSRTDNEGLGSYRNKKHFATTADPIAEIEKAAQIRDKDDGIIDDPKWKTGNEARAALLGSWKHATGVRAYEFLKDGKVKESTGGPATVLAYTFTDPQQLQIGNSPYRVLVSANDMYLVQSGTTLIGPFQRKK